MKTYNPAPKDVRERVERLIRRYHPHLEKNEVRFDLLFVEGDEPALTCRGCRAFAVVRVVGARERAKGAGDAEIVIDYRKFLAMPEPTQDAVLDHELYHVEMKTDVSGLLRFDAHHRPKLKLRKHDREFGWFDEMVRRHGNNSIESLQAHAIIEATGQLYFAFEVSARQPRLALPAPKEGIEKGRRRKKAA